MARKVGELWHCPLLSLHCHMMVDVIVVSLYRWDVADLPKRGVKGGYVQSADATRSFWNHEGEGVVTHI